MATGVGLAPEQREQKDSNGIWVRWIIGILVGLVLALSGFAVGLVQKDATAAQQMKDQAAAINELRAKQEVFAKEYATKEDVRQIREDLTYIRNRLDQVWGPPPVRSR